MLSTTPQKDTFVFSTISPSFALVTAGDQGY